MKSNVEVSTETFVTCQSNDCTWDSAIFHAEQEIESLTKQADRLKEAVKVFKANKLDGIQWPGQGKNNAATK